MSEKSSPSGVATLSRAGLVAIACFLVLVFVGSAAGQDRSPQPAPAYLRIVDGDVVLDRSGELVAADPGMPLVAGDRLRTQRGRAEVVFPDGAAVDLDENSELELQGAQTMRLSLGRAWLSVPRESTTLYQVDTPAATAYNDSPGEFRVSILGIRTLQTELAVARGRAQLVGDRGSVRLEAGERSLASLNDVPTRPETLTGDRFDAFDQWASVRRDERTAGASAQYLPPDLRAYGTTLDQNGTWQYESEYGYVWYPAVPATWRPYYTGYWATVPNYGWTWIGAEHWAWPTHHYGRWGHAHSKWFWIPERHWSPGWVSWGAAPGYISWCPLGFDNRPVYRMSAWYGSGGGWIVTPRDRFGAGREYVSHYAVSPRALPPHTPFVTQTGPPAAPGRAVPRRMIGSPTPDIAGPGVTQPRLGLGSRSRIAVGRTATTPEAARTGGTAVPGSSVGSTVSRGTVPSRPAAPAQRPAGETRRRTTSRVASAPGASSAAASPTRAERRYPFGDFRRTGDAPSQTGSPPQQPGLSAPQPPGVTIADVPRAVPRARSIEPQRVAPTAAQQPAAQRPPAVYRGRMGTAQAVPQQPPVSRGESGGATQAPWGGLRMASPRGSAPSGGAIGRSPQPAPAGAGQPAATSSSGDSGRAHAPESRRPPG